MALYYNIYKVKGVDVVVKNIISEIEECMRVVLNSFQMEELHKTLISNLNEFSISREKYYVETEQKNYLDMFICAKRVEGCLEKSIKYYKSTIERMMIYMNKDIDWVSTEDLRGYLGSYYTDSNCSKITVDNIRRILSSFFSWLEDENYIIKSPVRRIHKIRTSKTIKSTYSDENIEVIRDNCMEIRDLAIVDLLNSTGMRVGELVKLNISDINFNERECVVWGKGDKQRVVYLDAKAKIHLQEYLKSRKDNNDALFVSLLKPYRRLQISGVEIRLRELGKKLNIDKVHPHKFREWNINKAMAIFRATDKISPIFLLHSLKQPKVLQPFIDSAVGVRQQNLRRKLLLLKSNE